MIPWQPLAAEYPGIDRARYRFSAGGSSCEVTAIRVNLRTPGLLLAATERISGWVDGVREALTARVSDFITNQRNRGRNLAVAINADAFDLTDGGKSVPTNLRAFAMADGQVVSSGNVGGNAATLLWGRTIGARMQLTSANDPPDITGVETAVSGFSFALRDGTIDYGTGGTTLLPADFVAGLASAP